jgi:hypothetical protein
MKEEYSFLTFLPYNNEVFWRGRRGSIVIVPIPDAKFSIVEFNIGYFSFPDSRWNAS